MNKLLSLPLLGLALLPFLDAPSATSPARTAALRGYQIDASHSNVLFKIQHLGVSNFYGRFNDMSGSFVIDEEDASKSSIQIEVKTESVDTGDEGRDKHLKSPDFFSVRENPTITFASTKVAKKGANAFEVTGTLKYHGVEKELTFPAELVGAAETPMGERAGLEAQITIQRTDFGDSKYVNEGALGDEVLLTISLEGVAQ